MKSIIKIFNMDTQHDVRTIRETISSNSGIVASEISLSKKEITIIYNETFINIQDIINSIEDLGYIVM